MLCHEIVACMLGVDLSQMVLVPLRTSTLSVILSINQWGSQSITTSLSSNQRARTHFLGAKTRPHLLYQLACWACWAGASNIFSAVNLVLIKTQYPSPSLPSPALLFPPSTPSPPKTILVNRYTAWPLN